MKKINWGVIGLGNIAQRFSESFLEVQNSNLLAIASKDSLKLEQNKKKFNIKKTKLENSNFLFKNGLYIPCGLGNTFLEFNKVCNAILEYDKKFR